MRIDKYIWSVRLTKTRSIASDQVAKGKVRLNGEEVKPSKPVKVGDQVQVIRNTATFTYKIIGLLDRRVGAKLVADYLIDITPNEEVEKYKAYQLAQKGYRENGTGKPTKKDRRSLDDFLEGW